MAQPPLPDPPGFIAALEAHLADEEGEQEAPKRRAALSYFKKGLVPYAYYSAGGSVIALADADTYITGWTERTA